MIRLLFPFCFIVLLCEVRVKFSTHLSHSTITTGIKIKQSCHFSDTLENRLIKFQLYRTNVKCRLIVIACVQSMAEYGVELNLGINSAFILAVEESGKPITPHIKSRQYSRTWTQSICILREHRNTHAMFERAILSNIFIVTDVCALTHVHQSSGFELQQMRAKFRRRKNIRYVYLSTCWFCIWNHVTFKPNRWELDNKITKLFDTIHLNACTRASCLSDCGMLDWILHHSVLIGLYARFSEFCRIGQANSTRHFYSIFPNGVNRLQLIAGKNVDIVKKTLEA